MLVAENLLNYGDNVIESFNLVYLTLSDYEKDIWRLLHWYATKKNTVFPAHATIAEKVGCSVRTVIRAIKKFVGLDWLRTVRRCYRSSIYYIQDCLKKVNPKDPRIGDRKKHFVRENVTMDVTLSNVSCLSNNTCVGKDPETFQRKEKEIPFEYKSLPIANGQKQILADFPANVVQNALEDCRKFDKKEPIKNLWNFLYNRIQMYLGNKPFPYEKNKTEKNTNQMNYPAESLLHKHKNQKWAEDLSLHMQRKGLNRLLAATQIGLRVGEKTNFIVIPYEEENFIERVKTEFSKRCKS